MRWTAPLRSARPTGATFVLGLALLALGGCQNMMADMNNPMPPPPIADGAAPSGGGDASCRDAKNVWTGRMTALPNNSGNGGAGTGQSMVACFPSRQACHSWLLGASGAANGVIVEDRCTLNSSAATAG